MQDENLNIQLRSPINLIVDEDIDKLSQALVCDFCNYYPIEPEHAHFRCPNCKQRTSCCEGI